ncbi:hypothetical protein CR513_46719, partial [Mucuna pruriens]
MVVKWYCPECASTLWVLLCLIESEIATLDVKKPISLIPSSPPTTAATTTTTTTPPPPSSPPLISSLFSSLFSILLFSFFSSSTTTIITTTNPYSPFHTSFLSSLSSPFSLSFSFSLIPSTNHQPTAINTNLL